jgi:membrane dipeptidase
MWSIFDNHCDVLCKMLVDENIDFDSPSSGLDVTYPEMKANRYVVQNFAIFLSAASGHLRVEEFLRSIDLLYRNILAKPDISLIRTKKDLELIRNTPGRMGALLSLEGADVLQGQFALLRIGFMLGIRILGLTWNHANWAADGVMEKRAGGLTNLGRQLVRECNQMGIIIDVSHLSEAGFWELNDVSTRSFIATHSNAHAVCPHPRNLKDDQLHAIVQRDGFVGLTFVPYFVASSEQVTIQQLLFHIDHICSLGGEQHIGFGSDFDGIDRWMVDLERSGAYARLAEELHKYYSSEQAEGFLYKNAMRYYLRELPEE